MHRHTLVALCLFALQLTALNARYLQGDFTLCLADCFAAHLSAKVAPIVAPMRMRFISEPVQISRDVACCR